MNYKLIVTDMDGTLLGSDHEITQENKMALKEALDSGINVTVATGRMYSSAKSHIDFLESKVPIIACNGAIIKDCTTGEVIHRNIIEKDTCKSILNILEKHNVYYQYYSEDLLMCKDLKTNKDKLRILNKIMSKDVNLIFEENLENYIYDKDILKIIVIEDENISILETLKKDLSKIEGLEITKSWFNNMEIMAKGSNKGNAVKIVAEYLNIQRDDIIAFGDNHNDITMLEFAGTGVAMGNADEFVKSKADYVTKENTESGVAKALYELEWLKAVNS